MITIAGEGQSKEGEGDWKEKSSLQRRGKD